MSNVLKHFTHRKLQFIRIPGYLFTGWSIIIVPIKFYISFIAYIVRKGHRLFYTEYKTQYILNTEAIANRKPLF